LTPAQLVMLGGLNGHRALDIWIWGCASV